MGPVRPADVIEPDERHVAACLARTVGGAYQRLQLEHHPAIEHVERTAEHVAVGLLRLSWSCSSVSVVAI